MLKKYDIFIVNDKKFRIWWCKVRGKVYILDKNIKNILAVKVSYIYSLYSKEDYKVVFRFVNHNLSTDKGLKSMVSLARKCVKTLSGEKVKRYMKEILICEELYFADKRKRG